MGYEEKPCMVWTVFSALLSVNVVTHCNVNSPQYMQSHPLPPLALRRRQCQTELLKEVLYMLACQIVSKTLEEKQYLLN